MNAEKVWRPLPDVGSRRTCRGRIEVLAMPQLQDQQLPQPERVIAPAGEMLLQQARHEHGLEVSALLRSGSVEDLGEQPRQSPAEPGTERNPEALLFAIQNAGREHRAQRFLHDVLPAAVPALEAGAQRGDEVGRRPGPGTRSNRATLGCGRYRSDPPNSSAPPSPDRTTVTCRRAISDTYQAGIADESANGSSKCAIRSSRIDNPSGRTTSS